MDPLNQIRFLVLLVFGALIAAPSSSLAVAPTCAEFKKWATSEPVLSPLTKIIARSSEVIRQGRDENSSSTLFRGSNDWHSAVHARWAELRIQRFKNDPPRTEQKRAAQIRFIPSLLRSEWNEVRQSAVFFEENPYGYVWFLTLLDELDQFDVRGAEIDSIRSEVISDVFSWFTDVNFNQDFFGRCVGTQQSWELNYFLFQSTQAFARLPKIQKDALDALWKESPCVANNLDDTLAFADMNAIFSYLERKSSRGPAPRNRPNAKALMTQQECAMHDWLHKNGFLPLIADDYNSILLLTRIIQENSSAAGFDPEAEFDPALSKTPPKSEFVAKINKGSARIRDAHLPAQAITTMWTSFASFESLPESECLKLSEKFKRTYKDIVHGKLGKDESTAHYLPQFMVYGLNLMQRTSP